MKKELTLLILFLPSLIFAQVEIKNGGLVIDFSKKKGKNAQTDTTKKEDRIPDENEEPAKVVKLKKDKADQQEDDVNFKRDGLFKALFIGGLNLTQVDGDNQAGYTKPGAHVGVGVMIKFHKYMSVSMELLYSMKGANRRMDLNQSPPYSWKTKWDYVEVPLLFNVHDKKLIIASAGLSFGYLVNNSFTYSSPADTTGGAEPFPYYHFYLIEPRKFDLSAVVGFQFLIKKVLGIGARFEYSLLPIRPSVPDNLKILNMYNNSITIRLMYILDTVRKKKKH